MVRHRLAQANEALVDGRLVVGREEYLLVGRFKRTVVLHPLVLPDESVQAVLNDRHPTIDIISEDKAANVVKLSVSISDPCTLVPILVV